MKRSNIILVALIAIILLVVYVYINSDTEHSTAQIDIGSRTGVTIDNKTALQNKIALIQEHNVLTRELTDIAQNFKTDTKNEVLIQRIHSIKIRSEIIEKYEKLSDVDKSYLGKITYMYSENIKKFDNIAKANATGSTLSGSYTIAILTSTGFTDNSTQEIGTQTITETGKKAIIGTTDIPTYQQKRYANTCMIDNIALIVKALKHKTLNKDYVYETIGKNVGEMWHSGGYYVGTHGEGYFAPITKSDYLLDTDTQKFVLKNAVRTGGGDKYTNNFNEANDFELARQAGIISDDGNTYGKLELYIEGGMPVVMEVPMEVLYPNVSKWKGSDVWHAISIFAIDPNTKEIIYSNTLTGKVERLPLSAIRSDVDKQYLKYPFHWIDVDKTNSNVLN